MFELHETAALRTKETRYYIARPREGYIAQRGRKLFDAARRKLAPNAEVFELVGRMPAFDCTVDGRKAVVYMPF